ncbi:MAG: glycosyltransferase family 87 protein [Candidatus Firestonebacteria bacterium]|nr:glycosyltransferase family 87 protein [Candidatus Firestonebacteria bacterium]
MPKKITRAVYYITILLAVVLFSEKFIIKTLLCPAVSYTDFTSYYIAADAIKQKGSPYDSIDIRDNHIVNVVKPEELERMGIKFSVPEKYAYTYPPVLSLLLVPLTYLKYPSAVVFWNIINLFIFASSVCLTLLIINSRPFALITALTLLLFLGSMPSYETFSLGQVNYFVYSLCLAAFIYEERGQSKLSAFLLAFASVLKVTPVALALYFLFFSKRKDYIVYYAGFGLGILLLSGLPIGLSNLYYYLTYILPKLAGSYLLDNNKALTSLFSRVFLENPMVTPLLISKTLANTFTAVIAAVIISVTGIILVRAKILRSYESRVLAFSSCLVFMLLLQTLLEIHHLIYAFLPLLVVIYYSKLKPVTKTGVFLLLIMMLNTRGWNAMVHFGSGWWVIFLTAPQILGLILLFFFLYIEVSRLRCSSNIQTFMANPEKQTK